MDDIAPPPLNIPHGDVAVTVSAIDSTTFMVAAPAEMMWNPVIKGFDRVRCGCWSLFIEHPSGRKLLYDLGTRKDLAGLAPAIGLRAYIEAGIIQEYRVEKDVSEILVEGGMALEDIEAVIWSHFHFDHTGDVSSFPRSTKLIVGAGTKDAFMPGYPIDPKAQTLSSDFEGRDVLELGFEQPSAINIGRFRAIDYFGDGSFFILDSPGHAIGHVNALARTSTNPPTFIHFCGDSAHHAAEIRPSQYFPLPEHIKPSPVPHIYGDICPGHAFSSILRDGCTGSHILQLQDPMAGQYPDQKFALIYDDASLRETIAKTEAIDANPDVFTVLAHDWSLKGVIDEWPASLNDWHRKGWKQNSRWKFLEDFAGVVEGS